MCFPTLHPCDPPRLFPPPPQKKNALNGEVLPVMMHQGNRRSEKHEVARPPGEQARLRSRAARFAEGRRHCRHDGPLISFDLARVGPYCLRPRLPLLQRRFTASGPAATTSSRLFAAARSGGCGLQFLYLGQQ